MKRSTTPLVVALGWLVACGSDKKTATEPETHSAGTVSITYSGGGGSGSFSATGFVTPATSETAGNISFAVAVRGSSSAGQTSFSVVSNAPRTVTVADQALLGISRQTPGTASIDPNCSILKGPGCTGFVFLVGVGSGQLPSGICTLTSGTITIMSITSTRLTGTVSGTGRCAIGGDGTFTVTSGSFDVPVFDEPG